MLLRLLGIILVIILVLYILCEKLSNGRRLSLSSPHKPPPTTRDPTHVYTNPTIDVDPPTTLAEARLILGDGDTKSLERKIDNELEQLVQLTKSGTLDEVSVDRRLQVLCYAFMILTGEVPRFIVRVSAEVGKLNSISREDAESELAGIYPGSTPVSDKSRRYVEGLVRCIHNRQDKNRYSCGQLLAIHCVLYRKAFDTLPPTLSSE